MAEYNLYAKIDFPPKTIDVLCVGEMLCDMIGSPERSYQPHWGGSPANIAMNVRKLGGESRLASAVGRDALGDMLVSQAESCGLDSTFLQRVNCATSLVLINQTDGTPVPAFYRFADTMLEYTKELADCAANAKIIHFSCWPISVGKTRETVKKLVSAAKAQDTVVCFDPNYHPMLWQEGEDGIAYLKDFIGCCDIVKPSLDDSQRIFGITDKEEIISRFHKLGAKLVVLTLGRDGLMVSDGRNCKAYPTLATEVVDATGAGDSFWSGFYTGITKGFPIEKAVMAGSAASAFKLKYIGASSPMPEMDELLKQYGI